jgi:hypothetical protein
MKFAFALALVLAPLSAWGAGTVTLAWDPSTGNDPIASYNIYYGAASATYTNTVSAGLNTTVTISNLVEGVVYYFAATAVDTTGLESDFSTEVSALISGAAQPPQTQVVVVTTRYAVNLEYCARLGDPWELLNATNWCATNPPQGACFRAVAPLPEVFIGVTRQ